MARVKDADDLADHNVEEETGLYAALLESIFDGYWDQLESEF